MEGFNGFRTESLLDTSTSTIEEQEVQPMDAALIDVHVDAQAEYAEAEYEDDEDAPPESTVFSLPSILLDSSAALQAAQRLYAASQSGLRFFSDFRRVVPTSQLRAEHREELLDDDDHDLDLIETH